MSKCTPWILLHDLQRLSALLFAASSSSGCTCKALSKYTKKDLQDVNHGLSTSQRPHSENLDKDEGTWDDDAQGVPMVWSEQAAVLLEGQDDVRSRIQCFIPLHAGPIAAILACRT